MLTDGIGHINLISGLATTHPKIFMWIDKGDFLLYWGRDSIPRLGWHTDGRQLHDHKTTSYNIDAVGNINKPKNSQSHSNPSRQDQLNEQH